MSRVDVAPGLTLKSLFSEPLFSFAMAKSANFGGYRTPLDLGPLGNFLGAHPSLAEQSSNHQEILRWCRKSSILVSRLSDGWETCAGWYNSPVTKQLVATYHGASWWFALMHLAIYMLGGSTIRFSWLLQRVSNKKHPMIQNSWFSVRNQPQNSGSPIERIPIQHPVDIAHDIVWRLKTGYEYHLDCD